jgi:hypothetical protein
MSLSLKHRQLFGAAAWAVCCVAPLLTPFAVAGAAATLPTFIFAGVVFGLEVGALLAVWNQRRQQPREVCAPDVGPDDVVSGRPPDRQRAASWPSPGSFSWPPTTERRSDFRLTRS